MSLKLSYALLPLALLLAAPVVAPGSQDFRKHYGEPDTERFITRPGISLTVQYGSDLLACQMLIESPRQPLRPDSQPPLISPDKVTDIPDEVVPTNTRGNEINHVVANAGCNSFNLTEYENVSINRATHECLPMQPDREFSATITFKRDISRNEFK